MSRRSATLLAAVVATGALALFGTPYVGPLAGGPAAAATGPVSTADEPDGAAVADPLRVDIDTITPGVIPRRGPVRVSGTLANLSEDTWTTVNLYAFVSATPMTTAAELDAATDTPADAVLGDRIAEADASYKVAEIAPGDTLPFSFEVPRSLIPVTEAGVYWFGVQALGQGPEGRVLAGRARTFLPLVGQRTEPVDLAVVVPLRRGIVHEADGRIADLDDWTAALSSGGRLRSLVDLGASAGSGAVTYLLDPALVETVQRLADGNPARSLRATVPEGQGEGADEPKSTDGPSDGPSDPPADPTAAGHDPSTGADPEPSASATPVVPEDPETARAQAAAQDWLPRLRSALAGHEVLALPYGDLDVPAAAQLSPRTYTGARLRSTQVLDGLGIPSTPTVGSPGGYLDQAGLDLTDTGDAVLISDAMFTRGANAVSDPAQIPTVATASGRRIVVTSTASVEGTGSDAESASGSAGVTLLSMRQSTLAQAAVRALDPRHEPLAVMVPGDANPTTTSGFFSGLDVDWLDLTSVTDLADANPSSAVAVADLAYPRSQTETEIGVSGFGAAAALGRAGDRLQRLLTRNDQIGRSVRDEALTTLSYTSRAQPALNRISAEQSLAWIQDRLDRVRIESPGSFTMTGTSGTFFTTVVNDLPQPVTVALRATVGDDGVEVSRPDPVQVPAAGRARVLMRASAPSGGLHPVTLRLTDADGAPLGATDRLTVRSLQVSGVIWIFLGAAGVLLFGAIGVRLVRRVRAARRTSRDGGPPDPADPASPDPVRVEEEVGA